MSKTSLAEFFDDHSPIFRSKLEMLHDVWEAKRCGNALPKWPDFSARDLKTLLANIAVIQRIGSPPRYKIRMMGSGCVRIGGKDYTGCWVDETAHHISRKGIEASYSQCLEGRTPVYRRVEYIKERMVRAVVHRLFLPCLDADGSADIVLVGAYKIEEFGHFYELPADLQEKVKVEKDQTIALL